MKRLLTTLCALLAGVMLLAQPTGGVKGVVVSRGDRQPVEGARLVLLQGAAELTETVSAADGSFLIENLEDGMYTLVITCEDFLETHVQVTVNDGFVKNMFNLSLTSAQRAIEIDDDAFAAFDMDDSGYNDNPTILFDANDVFNNIAGYNFSAVRFQARGYTSESQDVYLAGVKMNDAVTGYSPFSLWSGLNEAMRSKETVNGSEVSDFGFGGYNGLTNIFANASNVRKGWRGSVLTNSSLYRLRLMGTYASGPLDNGWSYAVNVSARLGGNDWIDGVYYRSFAYYLAADKKFGDAHQLGFVFFSTPGQRGAQNASTQEVYDLMGDNMYNSNWGYQNGRVRNARVRKTNEPIAILKYDYTPSDRFQASATLLYRFGKNGYTALDWYDAQDPRPDYYRNLPSYFYDANPDMNRNNFVKYAWAKEVWTHSSDYPNLTHIDWDRLYAVNRISRRPSRPVRPRPSSSQVESAPGSTAARTINWSPTCSAEIFSSTSTTSRSAISRPLPPRSRTIWIIIWPTGAPRCSMSVTNTAMTTMRRCARPKAGSTAASPSATSAPASAAVSASSPSGARALCARASSQVSTRAAGRSSWTA